MSATTGVAARTVERSAADRLGYRRMICRASVPPEPVSHATSSTGRRGGRAHRLQVADVSGKRQVVRTPSLIQQGDPEHMKVSCKSTAGRAGAEWKPR